MNRDTKSHEIKISPAMMGLVGGSLLLILSIAFSVAVFAAPVAKTKQKPKQKPTTSREIIFDGSSVNGRYHSAGEAVARVEAEKNLNELIGPRKNFRDRLAAERERLNSVPSATAVATTAATTSTEK
jgi:hypothetical protein